MMLSSLGAAAGRHTRPAFVLRRPPRPFFIRCHASSASSSIPNDDARRLLDEVEASLKGPCGLPNAQGQAPPHTVVVAVSGGVDSMALLYLLAEMRTRWEPPLAMTVAHFNHGLRAESDEEEAFVRAAAAQLQVPIHVATWGEADRTQPTGIQERARNWRRAECEQVLRKSQGQGQGKSHGVVATAHHADDSMETWVLKLLRGAHLSHLKGMEPRAGAYIKPLLYQPKERLVAFLEGRGLEWKEDATNHLDKYRRNRVRLRLLPLMAELAGGEVALKTRMDELTLQSRGLEEWLAQEASAWEARHTTGAPADVQAHELWMGAAWTAAPRLLQEELLHRLVSRVTQGTLSLPYGQVRRAMEQLQQDDAKAAGGARKSLQWRLEVGEGWVLERQGSVLRVAAQQGKEQGGGHDREAEEEDREVAVPDAGVTLLVPPGWEVDAARLVSLKEEEKKWDLVLHHVPQDACLQLRHRRDGDRFHPAWRPGPVKLKDFLRGQRIPLHRRDEVVLVVHLEPEKGEETVLGLHPSGHVAAEATSKEEEEAGGRGKRVPPLGLRLHKTA